MTPPSRLIRAAVAVAATGALSLGAAATAAAAPSRSAQTTAYTHTTFLQHALGLPAGSDPVIESVTYDRFQHLLQQPGKFALLIGDPSTDPSFDDRARDVDAAAAAAGVKRVYWFNPNLTGGAQVGDFTAPALDIRAPSTISSLGLRDRTRDIYDAAWLNLVGEYLGNGVTATRQNIGTQQATVTAVTGVSAASNDAGSAAGKSTEVGNPNGGALYDYASGSAPADVRESYFVIYDQDRKDGGQPAKIAAWIDLTDEAGSASTKTKVATAIAAAGGGAAIGRVDQFAWWKSEANSRQFKQAGAPAQGAENGEVKILGDEDNAAENGGWRVDQITYPELADLLEHGDDANAVILFGGTWCPNTRAVLKFVNRQAQDHDVRVFNFDTVLDGGIVGGGTTSSANPLQIRNNDAYTAGGGAPAVPNSNPSFLYGELVDHYLKNLNTQYQPASNGVAYRPNADKAAPTVTTRRLQVPFLFGYQGAAGAAANDGVKRQWLRTLPGGAVTEYMSQWYYTSPRASQLGLTSIPADAAVWGTINAQLASFTWQSDPQAVVPNSATDADDSQFLGAADRAKVTVSGSTVTVASTTTVPDAGTPDETNVSISPTALSTALGALGGSAPTSNAGAKTALAAAEAEGTDAAKIANLRVVAGAFHIAQIRKTAVVNAWGNADRAEGPSGVHGGLNAVRALDVFFDGLPDRATTTPDDPGQQPQPEPQQPQPQQPAAPAPAPSTPAPSVPGPRPGTTTVPPKAKARKLAGTVVKAPTSRRGGRLSVKVTVPKGAAKATGKVTVKLKKGSRTVTVTGTLRGGTVTVALPKLAKGTWKVTLSWRGDARYAAASSTGTLKVTR